MIVVAEVAVWLLSPREEPLEPVPVAESEYFSSARDRAREDYRDGQRWLMLAGLAVEGVVLVARRPRAPSAGAPGPRAARRPAAARAPRPPAPASRC